MLHAWLSFLSQKLKIILSWCCSHLTRWKKIIFATFNLCVSISIITVLGIDCLNVWVWRCSMFIECISTQKLWEIREGERQKDIDEMIIKRCFYVSIICAFAFSLAKERKTLAIYLNSIRFMPNHVRCFHRSVIKSRNEQIALHWEQFTLL